MHGSNSTLRLAASLGVFAYFILATFEVFYRVEVDHDRSIRQLSEEEEEHRTVSKGRQLNILTLGGSVTWGAMDNRYDAYPFRLRDHNGHKVTNLAIRGTGSDYPAQCISTMLGGESNELTNYDPDVPFDVIIFEFSINGMHGIQLLLQRLRERFPDAFFIYVDVFSLKSSNGAFDSKAARKLVMENGGEVYNFGNTGVANAHYNFREEIEDRSNPTEEIRAMFGGDRHHPSAIGHNLISSKVIEIISQHEFPSKPRLGSWLGGDTCFSWYEDGEPFLHINDGGQMKEWDEEKHKWAIEVSYKHGAILQYNHKSDKDASISLQHMTKANERDDPYTSMYPPVIISIEQTGYDIGVRKSAAIQSEVELERDNVKTVNKIGEGWKYLSGLHRTKFRTFHVTEVSNVGTLKPGKNFIYIYPVEKRAYPFRLTATIICEACERLGWGEDLGW